MTFQSNRPCGSFPSSPALPPAAFTLIELLVVVTTIGILSSVLLPGMARARVASKGFVCRSNLQQWGLATHLFATGNDDWLPQDGSPNGTWLSGGWYNDLPSALGIPTYHELSWRTNPLIDPGRSLWICPSNTRRSNINNLFHYALNRRVNGGGSNSHPVRLGNIPAPALTVWLFDNGRLAGVATENAVHTNLHARGAQFLFLDGHVAHHRNTDYWDFKRNRGRLDQPNLRWIP
ncbi:MAG: type II secretion system protein [Pedosphaera sp.]|nr:type II secretion system protein [Pedosphaera sp.]